MRYDSVINLVLHMTPDAKKVLAVCILVSSPTIICQLYSITQMPTYGSYENRGEGSGMTSIKHCGLHYKLLGTFNTVHL